MRVIRKSCLGLDLHKKQITAHLRVHQGSDLEPLGLDRQFKTMPEDLERLRDWIREHQVTDVVMESTSVYWMHLYDLLEGVTQPAVVNAAHVKKVPGRKTDVSDAQWLAELHAHGLLRLSFVPPKKSSRACGALTFCISDLKILVVLFRAEATDQSYNRTIKLLRPLGSSSRPWSAIRLAKRGERSSTTWRQAKRPLPNSLHEPKEAFATRCLSSNARSNTPSRLINVSFSACSCEPSI